MVLDNTRVSVAFRRRAFRKHLDQELWHYLLLRSIGLARRWLQQRWRLCATLRKKPSRLPNTRSWIPRALRLKRTCGVNSSATLQRLIWTLVRLTIQFLLALDSYSCTGVLIETLTLKFCIRCAAIVLSRVALFRCLRIGRRGFPRPWFRRRLLHWLWSSERKVAYKPKFMYSGHLRNSRRLAIEVCSQGRCSNYRVMMSRASFYCVPPWTTWYGSVIRAVTSERNSAPTTLFAKLTF